VQTYADQTNLVQNISIQLNGIKQGRSVTNGDVVSKSVDFVRVGTRQVIQALATATGNTFSTRANLVLVTPQDGGASSVEVRDGDTKVDVTSFLILQPLSDSLQSIRSNWRIRGAVESDYNIEQVALVDGYAPVGLHFNVNGIGTQTSTTGIGNRQINNLTIQASGSGDLGGDLLILQGTVVIFGQTTEVVGGGVIVS
jgi:hypothetical protein